MIFTVDLEDWYHGVIPLEEWEQRRPRIMENTSWLLEILHRYQIHAVFYALGDVVLRWPQLIRTIVAMGHRVGSHGFYHGHNERQGDLSDLLTRRLLDEIRSSFGSVQKPIYGYRSAYWDTTPMPGWSGGLFFRTLPWSIFLRNLKRSRTFWIHPYDLDEEHPPLKNPLRQWERRAGLPHARKRLRALLEEICFEEP